MYSQNLNHVPKVYQEVKIMGFKFNDEGTFSDGRYTEES
jgi:hypothetical protein